MVLRYHGEAARALHLPEQRNRRMSGRITLVVFTLSVAGILGQQPAQAITLWTENAENGYGEVIDGTAVSYPLIQSDVAGQGNNAFHLATPTGADNWFAIDETLTMQSDTKLFFLSRLGWATTSQIARVQISTNGGGTWPTNIVNQTGSGGSGEGSFSLKEIDLSSYSGQNLRFRFYYDVVPGSYYPQTDPGVGWYVDDIQIGSEYQKPQWSIGNPSAHEQQYLEYVNRARADAMVEAARLRDETDPDIQSAYNFFGIDEPDIVTQFQYHINNGYMDQFAQPLSFQANLLQAAQLHTLDQFNNQFQGHVSSNNPPAPFQPGYNLGNRATAVGYGFQSLGENVYSNADSVAQGHAGFDVDWGIQNTVGAPGYNPAFNDQGMQNPPGHRFNIHNGDWKEIGIGVINGTNGSVGPQVVTEDFGRPLGDIIYITGVVYEDLNSNDFYDIGEGRSGVRVDVEGASFYAVSTASGGYSVPVPGNGTYEVEFSGGGFQTYEATATVSDGENEKVDYLVSAVTPLDGDYNNDGIVDTADYVMWRKRTAIGDYATWRTHFGESNLGSGGDSPFQTGVPEPASAVLMALPGAVVVGMRRRSSRVI
jgi:uncharacterized protein YkwD